MTPLAGIVGRGLECACPPSTAPSWVLSTVSAWPVPAIVIAVAAALALYGLLIAGTLHALARRKHRRTQPRSHRTEHHHDPGDARAAGGAVRRTPTAGSAADAAMARGTGSAANGRGVRRPTNGDTE